MPSLVNQDFDTEVFGAPVARLADAAEFAPDRMPAEWREKKLWLVSCRVPEPDDSKLGPALVAGGFRRVETLVTLEHQLGTIAEVVDHGVRTATKDDVLECREIAAAAFELSRYNLDPQIDRSRAAEYKARWAENAIRGRADSAFVERAGGRVRGFNFCLLRHGVAIIDLIAVATQDRGKGIGNALVNRALAHYKPLARRMRVGTQAENTRSLALYTACGFREVSRAATYHWINRDAAP